MTTHLTPDELVDLAEGARAEHSAPHLAACDRCRRQVADLRTAIAAAASVEVPEPSPLFWNHLSSRVREAVAREPVAALSWWSSVPVPALAAAAFIAVLAVAVGYRTIVDRPAVGAPPSVARQALPDSSDTLGDVTDDASLTVVADLTDLDLDAASEAGLTTAGSADHAVTHLNGDELEELQRLLKVELGRPQANVG